MDDSRVALVTGGMSGLGTAICRRLDAAGFRVATTYSPQQPYPQAWLAAQRDDGHRLHAYRVDAGDYAETEWIAQKVLAELGRIDVLVNHPALLRDRSLQHMSADEWHSVLRANLDSVFNMSKQVLEPMMAQRWGRIINIASIHAQSGAFGQANYAAATAGMHGLGKSLALEVARCGITVNTVSPGYLRSGAVDAMPKEFLDSVVLPAIPVGRLGEPDEVAALVAYLASDVAGFVTGANISINGGQHMA